MILVDTSIWIELFRKDTKIHITTEHLLLLSTCPPVLQELMQGLRDDANGRKIRESLLSLPCLPEAVNKETYLHAANIYKVCQRRGSTIRSSIDCLIAAIAIEQDWTVWHRDRDFDQIAKYTDLKVIHNL